MIFKDKRLIFLVGIIVILILFLKMTSESFSNNDVKIINNNNNEIPLEITKPNGNYMKKCLNLIYNAETQILTGECNNDNNDVLHDVKYNFTKPCVYLNYSPTKEELVCRSSI
jgi:hypothetical protein